MVGEMKRASAVLLVLITMVLQTPLGSSSTQNLVIGEPIPSPVGHMFILDPPYPDRIYGFSLPFSGYIPYSASIGKTGVLFISEDYFTGIEKIYTDQGVFDFKIIEREKPQIYGVSIVNDVRSYILRPWGEIYKSSFKFIVNPPLSGVSVDDYETTILIYENKINISTQGRKILFITNPSVTVVIGRTEISLSLHSFLNTPEACIVQFRERDRLPWTFGVLDSLACTRESGIGTRHRVTYADRQFVTSFTLSTELGRGIELIVLAPPTIQVLETLGFISRVYFPYPSLHVLPVDRITENLYYAAGDRELVEIPVLTAIDVTQVVSEKRICAVPKDAVIIQKLAWRRLLNITGTTIEVYPGELVLFSYMNRTYICIGSLDWLFSKPPIIRAPSVREFSPIVVIMGGPFLLVFSNGKIVYGTYVEIPLSEVEENTAFLFAGDYFTVVHLNPPSIFTTPWFILFVFIFSIFATYILVPILRKEKVPDIVKIIWDVKPPPALSLISDEDLLKIVSKHVDMYGVCPDTIDIALYYRVLPKIPEEGIDPVNHAIICPFKTNIETERSLRAVSETLLPLFWGIKRMSRRRGLIYTILREDYVYMYFYKQEKETKPEHIVANALESIVYSSRFTTPLNKIPCGLVIIVSNNMYHSVKREIDELMKQSLRPGGRFSVTSYLAERGVATRVSPDEIQKIVDAEIPAVIVASERNMRDLLKHLADSITTVSEKYKKRWIAEGELMRHE